MLHTWLTAENRRSAALKHSRTRTGVCAPQKKNAPEGEASCQVSCGGMPGPADRRLHRSVQNVQAGRVPRLFWDCTALIQAGLARGTCPSIADVAGDVSGRFAPRRLGRFRALSLYFISAAVNRPPVCADFCKDHSFPVDHECMRLSGGMSRSASAPSLAKGERPATAAPSGSKAPGIGILVSAAKPAAAAAAPVRPAGAVLGSHHGKTRQLTVPRLLVRPRQPQPRLPLLTCHR